LQFRYVYPLCDRKEWYKLISTSPFIWQRENYPKDDDCYWKIQTNKGKREKCEKPPFIMTEYVKETKDERVNVFFK